MIHEEAQIGLNTKIYHSSLCNIGRCKIGADCVIHAGVQIHDGVVIGDRCKIQADALLFNGVTLEDDVFVGPGVTFTNDKHPKANGEWELSRTLIKKGANIGANATILPVTVGENATVGAGSVIVKDIPPGETWVGNPGRKL